MASCDDDFALLGDDAQSHHHHHQPAPSASPAAAAAIPFSGHRYVAKASVPIHSRSLPLKGAGAGDDNDGYNCFAADDEPFASQPPEVDDDDDAGDGKKSANPTRITPDPKRKDRDELSDGESPYCFAASGNKKPRPAAAPPSSSSGGGDYRKDREEWSDSAIGCLLDAYTDKYVQLNRGNLRGRDWEDVATVVSERCDKQKSGKSVEQCKNKVDNLKKRYKVECQRLSSGSLSVSHWPWFKKMEQIVGSSSSSSTKGAADDDKSANTLGGGSAAAMRQVKRYPAAAPSPSNLTNNLKMKSLSNPRWKRVVLKISGAALAGAGPQNVDPKVIMLIAREVAIASRIGVEVAIVVGGRNFFCGDTWVAATGTDRATTYQIGLLLGNQRKEQPKPMHILYGS